MAHTESEKQIVAFRKFGSILGLERIARLMELLGNPQDKLRYIHVAGTNGKGSVSRYIYEALEANGYKVGLFTSPFLEKFNERMEFHHELISDEDLRINTDRVLEQVKVMEAEGLESPTEFEVITAVAFMYFAMKEADFVVLEVGLGGRGDSTNIIRKPEISIITSIALDHTDRLGPTLSHIAAEKAGIIKEGVDVVMNVRDREAQVPIAKKAYEMGSVLHDVKKIGYAVTGKTLRGYTLDTNIYGTEYPEVEISMIGNHQVENIMTALTALEILRKKRVIKVERSRLYEGLKAAKQPGRFEIMGCSQRPAGAENTLFIIDGAHNVDGACAMTKTFKNHLEGVKTLMVVGILADKEPEKMLEVFGEVASDFIVTEPDNSRKMAADQLAALLREKGKNPQVVPEAEDAVKLAISKAADYDVVLCAGSLYMLGTIRHLLK